MIKIKYFVHGTTTDNSSHLSTGWLPGELSEKGIMQGIELAHIIKDQHFDVVFCSDLTRAVESAKLNFYNCDIEIIRDKRIRECNYGDYNGKDSKLVDYATHIDKQFPNDSFYGSLFLQKPVGHRTVLPLDKTASLYYSVLWNFRQCCVHPDLCGCSRLLPGCDS